MQKIIFHTSPSCSLLWIFHLFTQLVPTSTSRQDGGSGLSKSHEATAADDPKRPPSAAAHNLCDQCQLCSQSPANHILSAAHAFKENRQAIRTGVICHKHHSLPCKCSIIAQQTLSDKSLDDCSQRLITI